MNSSMLKTTGSGAIRLGSTHRIATMSRRCPPADGKTVDPASVPPPLHELEAEVMEELWRSGKLRCGR